MQWTSIDRLVWIAFATVSVLSGAIAALMIEDDESVLSSGVMFWIAIAVGAGAVAAHFYSIPRGRFGIGGEVERGKRHEAA